MIIGIPIGHNYLMPFEAVKCYFNLPYQIFYAEGPYIYINRNRLLGKAKQRNESLLMIDSDIVFTYEDILKIEDCLKDKDIITGVYSMGIPPYVPAILKRSKDDYEFTDIPKELSEIDACGGGFMGISSKVIEGLPENAFDNIFESKMHGEDISFCNTAKKKGYKIWCDPTIRVGHIRMKVIHS